VRVVIAPDSFGGTLSATEAAAAIARGWLRSAPSDELRELPLADGGTGFVEVLHAVLGGSPGEGVVTGPLDDARVTASFLVVGDTAYVEAAQACGLHLADRQRRTPGAAKAATSRGLGELVAVVAALPSVRRVVIGLGGSATTDCGAGMLAVWGAVPLDGEGHALADGGAALSRCARLAAAPVVPGGVELVMAADVTNPLLGRHGAAAVFGPQKGADADAVTDLDAALAVYVRALAAVTGKDPDELAATPGTGAAGGLGAALVACGAQQVSGAGLVRELCGLDAALDNADLVLTGEGSFDWQSLRGKLITSVAEAAAARGLPCLVLAGQVSVGRREAASVGVQDAYSVAEHVGGVDASLADPAGALSALAARVGAQWSGSR
jgi:glycerate kinase